MMNRFLGALVGITVTLGSVAGPATGQFVVTDPLNDHHYGDFFQEFYAELASDLNSSFARPQRVNLTSALCGQPNAYYDPEGRQIIFCAEMLDLLWQGVDAGMDESLQQLMLSAQIIFLLNHELGHALIHVLDLPALGQEEDVADQLAALLMTDEPMLAMWAAEMWRTFSGLTGGGQPSSSAFADTHDLDEQRYYNVMCWAYGADPLVRSYIAIASQLPPERAMNCQQEYSRLSSAFERLLTPHLKDPTMWDELNPKRNASGYWRFMEATEDAEGQVRCTASGTMGLWQTAEDIQGEVKQEGICVIGGIVIDSTGEAVIETGTIVGPTVILTGGGCTYTGRLQFPDATRIDGSIACEIPMEDGSVLEMKGEWSAVR